MGLFHRDKKNNDDEPDSVQTNSFSDIMNGLQYAVNCAQDTILIYNSGGGHRQHGRHSHP